MSTSTINYARLEGIEKNDLAPAIIFTIAYVPLLVLNIFRSIRHPTYVLIMLAIFCTIRITAFAMRAALAGSDTVGNNLNIYIAAQVLYSVGFFGLVYSAYTLVLDREKMLPHSGSQSHGVLGIIYKIMLNSHFVRIILMVAVALGITGAVKSSSSSQSDQNSAVTFRKASVYIFLVTVILLVILTAKLAKDEHDLGMRGAFGKEPVGRQYRLIVLLAIAFLCVGREAFFAATVNNTQKQNEAALFYPIAALFEWLAVALFASPGLVPSRREIAERQDYSSGSDREMAQQPQY